VDLMAAWQVGAPGARHFRSARACYLCCWIKYLCSRLFKERLTLRLAGGWRADRLIPALLEFEPAASLQPLLAAALSSLAARPCYHCRTRKQ